MEEGSGLWLGLELALGGIGLRVEQASTGSLGLGFDLGWGGLVGVGTGIGMSWWLVFGRWWEWLACASIVGCVLGTTL
jgi:hypothetical protein